MEELDGRVNRRRHLGRSTGMAGGALAAGAEAGHGTPAGPLGPAPPPGFEEAFRRLHPRVVAVARRVVGDRHLAEDVAAETFVRTYVRWGGVRDLPHLDGWVLRVATNLAIDALRRRARDDRRPAPPPRTVEEGDAVAVRAALAPALARLPARQRDALALRYLADLSEGDTARAMGVSAGTVKTHLHRGLQALRRCLGPIALEELDAV